MHLDLSIYILTPLTVGALATIVLLKARHMKSSTMREDSDDESDEGMDLDELESSLDKLSERIRVLEVLLLDEDNPDTLERKEDRI